MMRRLQGLSYRVRVPLTIMVVILLTEAVVAVALVSRSYLDARRDLESNASNLAAVLARSLREPMLRDDLWGAYEVVRTPVAVKTAQNFLQDIVVIDDRQRIYVSSDPNRFSVSSPEAGLPHELQSSVATLTVDKPFDFSFASRRSGADIVASNRIVADDGTLLGAVVLSFDAERFYQRVRDSLLQLAYISVPFFLLLIGLGWFWGNRLTQPLTKLTDAMRLVGKDPPSDVAEMLPRASGDEIGVLTEAFNGMLRQLERKEGLEREMVSAERLAAVGRVATGIAHEINNPLGGMLNAIDTLSKHGNPDGFTSKTLGLLHRGLSQIRTTVGALLVEARLDSPAMTATDWDDLRLLVTPEALARQVKFDWQQDLQQSVPLPAHQVRQLVLNLLLNAVKAAGPNGIVVGRVGLVSTGLQIQVSNNGESIDEETLKQLFEPFAQASVKNGKRSFGIGLWVSYQIVNNLGGVIAVRSENRMTRFTVTLPFDSQCETESCESSTAFV